MLTPTQAKLLDMQGPMCKREFNSLSPRARLRIMRVLCEYVQDIGGDFIDVRRELLRHVVQDERMHSQRQGR